MTEDQKQAIGWGKSKPLLHLVTLVRGDDLDLPIVEKRFECDDTLFGWVTSEETHLPLNIWTKRFKDWYEKDSGSTLIDHEIQGAYQGLADEADAVYHKYKDAESFGKDEKEIIFYALAQLQEVARFLDSQYASRAQKLADAISATSSRDEMALKPEFERAIHELNENVVSDLKTYNQEFCAKIK